jgi:VIT1/CCC1 family predicted Fe2+/Mn2+ transporter
VKEPAAPLPAELATLRVLLADEIDGIALYTALAEMTERPEVAEVYRRLAATEGRHAALWREKLRAAGAALPKEQPSRRTRILIALARRFGPQFILPTLVERESADAARYAGRAAAVPGGDERAHARVLSALAASGRGASGESLARLESRHSGVGGNALRAAVLGANDGLVSNLALVMGVAGAEMSERSILVTGLAGLLAGAGSMALGEWLSVQSSRELVMHQLELERAELEADPEEEAAELALVYQGRGIDAKTAREMADRLVAEPQKALDALAREELGVDPAELGGSAWVAAITSFVLFAIGAIIPVAPFFFLRGSAAVAASAAGSGLALFGLGAAITLMTGKGVWRSGLRQLLFGLTAALITWGIGRLIGVSLAG